MSAFDFRPAWWCRNTHTQTVWSSLARFRPRPRYRREILDLPDGDFLDIDWIDAGSARAVTVLIHGLCGNSGSAYMRGLAQRLVRAGSSVAAMNMRGAGGRMNRRARTYHSGLTADLDFLLTVLAQRNGAGIPVYCAGFSLGGNLLLKWLGENRGTDRVRAAAAVSAPMLLHEAARRMEHGVSRLYQSHLLRQLKDSVRRRRALFEGRIDIDRALAARNFREFDDAVTAPLNGFEDADDYYTHCSSRRHLNRISVPTLIVHARDDPFMTPAVIPERSELGDGVTLEVFDRGGHVGFVAGPAPGLSSYWLESRICDFFDLDRRV